jgi:hypothetical protein
VAHDANTWTVPAPQISSHSSLAFPNETLGQSADDSRMLYDISGRPIPKTLPYAKTIQAPCVELGFPPCLAYAIAWRESISGEVNGSWNAATVLSSDGGHGLFQLTSTFPEGWDNEDVNVRYALSNFLIPALHQFARRALRGDDLARVVAASFNAGESAAWKAHLAGDVDLATTGATYASAVLSTYQRLVKGENPA